MLVFKLLKSKVLLLILALLFTITSCLLWGFLNFLFGYLVDLLLAEEIIRFLNFLLIALFLVLFNFFLTYLTCLIIYKINSILVYKLRELMFDTFIQLTMTELDKYMSGDLVLLFTVDVDQMSDGISSTLIDLFTGLFTILTSLGFIFYFNYFIGFIILCFIPLIILTSSLITRFSHKHFLKLSNLKKQLSECYLESLDLFLETKAFCNESRLINKASKINNELTRSNIKAQFYSSLVNPTTRFLNALLFMTVGLVGLWCLTLNKFNLTLGIFEMLLLFTLNFTKPFNDVSNVITELQNSYASKKRIDKFLKSLTEDLGLKQNLVLNGNIRLEGVNFSYKENINILSNFNFKIKKGEHIGIVGSTGSGKSTIISLILNFYSVNSGNIYFDDYNLNDISLIDLRDNMMLVLQEPWIKKGTIYENLTYGINKGLEEVIIAAKHTKADHFISRLKNNYHTVITDTDLSEGEKQLLCFTRIFLRDNNILILDEATSNIDTRSELMIQKALLSLIKNKTAIIIAHRLKTVENMDKIIVLKDGIIQEIGSHKELLDKNGYYKQLYTSNYFIN